MNQPGPEDLMRVAGRMYDAALETITDGTPTLAWSELSEDHQKILAASMLPVIKACGQVGVSAAISKSSS